MHQNIRWFFVVDTNVHESSFWKGSKITGQQNQVAEQEDQGRVEGQWSQLGRVEDLLVDQELVWGLDKELLLVFVRKMQAEVGGQR